MTRLPRARGTEVIRALQRGGFEIAHIRGSHYYLRKPGQQRLVVVPVYGNRDLPTGTLRAVLRQADLRIEELARLLAD